MSIDLTIPERAPPPKDFDVRARTQIAWLRGLPLARTPEAADLLARRAAELNALRLDLDDRLQILGAFRGTAVALFEELETEYAKGAVPPGRRALEAVARARALADALSTGYRVVAVERMARWGGIGSRREVRLALFRAIELASVMLEASYKSYTAVPPGTWRQLHEIYLYADAQGVVRDAASLEEKGCVQDLYVRALAMSLADPYKLVRGELERIMGLAAFALADATLAPTRPSTATSAHFIVPCDTDKPPKPALSANDDPGGPNARVLDLNAVVERLQSRSKALDSGEVSAAMRKALPRDAAEGLRKLVRLWGDPPRRAHRRDAMESSVAICVGLPALGHFTGLQQQTRSDEADAIRRGITMPLLWIPDDERSLAFGVLEWDVVNQSAGGLKVRQPRPLPALGVGEAVGVKRVGDSGWTVAAVRWITADEDAIECGIEFMAGVARPVSIEPTIAAVPLAKPALVIEGVGGRAGTRALLAAPGSFSEMREFHVADEDSVHAVRALWLLERTARFELFEIGPS